MPYSIAYETRHHQGCQTWDFYPKILGIFEGDGIFLGFIFRKKLWDKSRELYKLLWKIFINMDILVQKVLLILTFS